MTISEVRFMVQIGLSYNDSYHVEGGKLEVAPEIEVLRRRTKKTRNTALALRHAPFECRPISLHMSSYPP